MSNNLRQRLKARKKKFRTTTFELEDGLEVTLREPSLSEIAAIQRANSMPGSEGIDEKFRIVVGLMVNADGTPFNKTSGQLDETMESLTTPEFIAMDAKIAEAFSPDQGDDAKQEAAE